MFFLNTESQSGPLITTLKALILIVVSNFWMVQYSKNHIPNIVHIFLFALQDWMSIRSKHAVACLLNLHLEALGPRIWESLSQVAGWFWYQMLAIQTTFHPFPNGTWDICIYLYIYINLASWKTSCCFYGPK